MEMDERFFKVELLSRVDKWRLWTANGIKVNSYFYTVKIELILNLWIGKKYIFIQQKSLTILHFKEV